MGEIIDLNTKRQFLKNEMGSAIPRPSANCSRCKKTFYTDELSALPEVETYIRQFADAMLHKKNPPVPVDEDMLMKKYGYGFKTVFCDDCLQKLIQNTK